MSGLSAFDSPPDVGNAWSLVAYYGIFLIVQLGLTPWYLRNWNWLIFLGLIIFLFLEILGSVAYVKLHYEPVTGVWYNLWLFTLSAAPTFFISGLNLCVYRLLQDKKHLTDLWRLVQLSPGAYLTACLGVDFLTLVLTMIGSAYAGAKSAGLPASSKPGYNLVTAAMAMQCCSIVAFIFVGYGITAPFTKSSPKTGAMAGGNAASDDKSSPAECVIQRPRSFKAFLICLLLTGLLLLARTIVRAVDLAGGIQGPIDGRVLVNVESILLFVAILLITALHPAINLRSIIANSSHV